MAVRQRKLYMVRVHTAGVTFGRQVGNGRLVPRVIALKIARRIRASRRHELVEIYPVMVNVTQEQQAYLYLRYGM